MKLEAIDPLNLGNIYVATICKVSLGALGLQAALPTDRAVAECPLLVFVHIDLAPGSDSAFSSGVRQRLANRVGWSRHVGHGIKLAG